MVCDRLRGRFGDGQPQFELAGAAPDGGGQHLFDFQTCTHIKLKHAAIPLNDIYAYIFEGRLCHTYSKLISIL